MCAPGARTVGATHVTPEAPALASTLPKRPKAPASRRSTPPDACPGARITTASKAPPRATYDESPTQPNPSCALITKCVSPAGALPERATAASVASAAHPTRRPASGPATPPAMGQGGRCRTIGSRSPIPSSATSAAELAPTSTHRSSAPTTAVSSRCCWAKCPLLRATTPAIGPAGVRMRTCWASKAWSQRGCRDPRPMRWTRRYPSSVIWLAAYAGRSSAHATTRRGEPEPERATRLPQRSASQPGISEASRSEVRVSYPVATSSASHEAIASIGPGAGVAAGWAATGAHSTVTPVQPASSVRRIRVRPSIRPPIASSAVRRPAPTGAGRDQLAGSDARRQRATLGEGRRASPPARPHTCQPGRLPCRDHPGAAPHGGITTARPRMAGSRWRGPARREHPGPARRGGITPAGPL